MNILTKFLPPWWPFAAAGILALAIVAGAWAIFHKGETTGEKTVINAVQKQAIDATETSRVNKERDIEDISRTPFGTRVDQLP